MQKVEKTKTGHYFKIIPNFGMLIYSPYTSLIYGVAQEYTGSTVDYLNGSKVKLINEIKQPLLFGLKSNSDKIKFSDNHLLPSKSYWNDYTQPDETITVNWFLTGKCNFKCKYCYASDLMYDYVKEPSGNEIEKTAKRILALNPLSVVLTGGEPLISPHISDAIRLIAQKTGIIIDTNGSELNDDLLNLIEQNNIVIRISLDSPRPNQNIKHRIAKNNKKETFNEVLENINKCTKRGIPVIVQTVVSSLNKNELVDFGEILLRLGVSGWRLLKVQESKLNSEEYKKLMVGRTKKIKEASEQIDYQLDRIKQFHKNKWNSKMSLQVSKNSNSDRNSVILVSPSGEFRTESKLSIEKNLIDKNSPKCPDKNQLFKKVSNFSHFSRYLNIQ